MTRDLIPSLVSAIIPVFNGEAFLRQAIESVLAQDYAPLEIIVVDDGSVDDSMAIAAAWGPPVRCFSREHRGIAASRNFGVQNSVGTYIAFLDADDLWLPAKTSRQMKLIQDRNLEAAWGEVENFYETDADRRFEVRVGAGTSAHYHAGSMLIRRETFLRIGYFDTRFEIGEFIDWFARAKAAGLRSDAVEEVVLRRRLHGKNSSITASYGEEFLRIARENLARRRAGAG